MAVEIGSPAIDRASSVTSGYTEVDKNNPANESGIINKVEIFAVSGNDMQNVEVGIFYIVSGNNLSTRDSVYIGTVVGGAKRTFDVNLTVQAGDYIGVFWTGGRIEYTSGTATGDWRKAGDNIPCTNTAFALYVNRTMSLYGYSAAPPDPPTNVQATNGTYTDRVRITWTKSDGATDYQVYRDGTPLGWCGDISLADDYGADAPTITHGSVTASDGDSYAYIGLSNPGASANNGTVHVYKVKARNTAGESGYSLTDTGFRGVGTLTYQWYRSSGDSDANYSLIPGAIYDNHADEDAPAPTITVGTASASDGASSEYVTLSIAGESANVGAGRYYKCYHTATGATPGYTGVNRGYRGVGSLTYQWQRSAGDSDADYSNIDGGTTDPYNDTEAPENGDGRYYRCVLNAVGAGEIDVGDLAIDRGNALGSYTLVNKGNPANASGTITSVEIWAATTLSNCEVATFFVVSGNNLSTRDTHTIGTVTAGSKQTFSGLDITVEAGDYIGIYYSAGTLEVDNTGGDGIWFLSAADHIPCTNQLFSFATGWMFSLCAIGISLSQTNTDRGYRLKKLFVSLFGVISFIGNVGRIKSTYKFVSGIITFMGNVGIVKALYKTLSGIISFIGDVDKIKTIYKFLSGIVSFIGNVDIEVIIALIKVALSGTLTFVGNIGTIKSIYKSLSGIITFIGSARKTTYKSLSGVITFVGNLGIKQLLYKILSGTVSFVGSVKKGMFKSLSGIVSFVGNVNAEITELIKLILSGALTFMGNLEKRQELKKSLTGIITFVGFVKKGMFESLSGVVSFLGDLSAVRIFSETITGIITFVGDVGRVKTVYKSIVGVVGFVGSIEITKFLYKTLSGVVSFVGNVGVGRIFCQYISGIVTFMGNLEKRQELKKSLTGVIVFLGSVGIKQTLKKAITGLLTFTGSLKKGFLLTQLLTGVISFTGLLGRIKKYAWTLISKIKGDWDRVDKEKEDSTLVSKEKGDFTRVEKEKEDFTKVEKEKEDWKRVKK